MSDGKPKFQGQIISKKAKATNDEPSRKKPKKGKKRGQQEQEDFRPSQQQLRQQPRNGLTHPVRNKKKDHARVFEEISSICSTYKSATIRAVLEDCSYDKEEALNKLFDMRPDGDDKEQEDWGKDLQKVQTQSGDTSHPSSEIANNLMNEVFDSFLQEQINGRQFEQLFEEIAEMIKDDEESGMGVFQINSFVDECNSIKQTLLVGFREELSNFDDFQFDQSYPLYAQTQQFLEEQIKRQVQQQKRREEDFPTLGAARNSQRNIVDRIRHQQRKKKEETTHLFMPSKNSVPQFARERNNELSIFNVDNKLKSEKDMLSLHKEFSDMPIQDLKFVYKTFVADYNICREFLIKYYDSKRNTRVYEVNRPANSLPRHPSRKVYASRLSKEKVDEQLKHLSLEQLRQEIDHLYKLKQALQLTKMKIHSANQKLQLDRMINEKMPIIAKLSQASRLILVGRMAKTNPLYIDLHGYRQEEIFPLLSRIADMIVDEFDQGNEKIRLKKVKGRQTACLIVMTGKGLHSQGNKSILKPTVFDWCREKDIEFEESDDHVKVYVGVDR